MTRHAVLTDTPELLRLSRLFLDTSSYGAMLAGATDESLTDVIALCLEHGVVLVDELQPGELTGMVACLLLPHPISNEVFLDEVVWFVDPKYRSGRVGVRLLVAVETWATTNRVSLVKMLAPSDSDVGNFLARRGYSPIETAYIKRLG